MSKLCKNGFIEEKINKEGNSDQDLSEEEISDDCEMNDLKDDKEQNLMDSNKVDTDSIKLQKNNKKRKKGIIYVSNLPKHMNVTRIREILGQYGDIGRIFLQPEKISENNKNSNKKKKKKRLSRHFTEGWIEFNSKRVAKKIVEFLNNQQISSSKRSQFYDNLWNMRYLPRFKWVHLTERLNYERAVYKQRLLNEVSQARKEATFFQNNLDKSEFLKKKNKKQSSKSK